MLAVVQWSGDIFFQVELSAVSMLSATTLSLSLRDTNSVWFMTDCLETCI